MEKIVCKHLNYKTIQHMVPWGEIAYFERWCRDCGALGTFKVTYNFEKGLIKLNRVKWVKPNRKGV